MEVVQAVDGISDETLKEKFRKAVACIHRTIDLYSMDGIAFSFNGGKDSTVLLHVIRAAVATYAPRLSHAGQTCANGNTEPGLAGISTFIFERKDDFREILDFVHTTNEAYRLQMLELDGDFKSGVERMLERTPIRAIVLGTRRGDPNAEGQDVFCPSSADWPPFMRVNPILDWAYTDVWTFLRSAKLPYCKMYDRGFTSIGATHNTVPNTALKKEDGTYAPAHMLADSRLERAGRISGLVSDTSDAAAITRTAALVIVGDEILSAKVEEVNIMFLCRELRAIGWRVCKVVILPDEVAAISAEVRACSEAYEVVVTTGGVGPTRDDVTMAGVADALSRPLVRDPALETRLRAYFGEHITKAHLKMAEAPAGECKLIEYVREDGRVSPFPLMRCRNIYVLPGVPSLLQQKWKVVKEQMQQEEHLTPFRCITLRLALTDETAIAPALDQVASAMGSQVSIGSYPVSEQSDGTGIVLALESKDMQQLQEARDLLISKLPREALTQEEHDAASYSRRMSRDVSRTASPNPKA